MKQFSWLTVILALGVCAVCMRMACERNSDIVSDSSEMDVLSCIMSRASVRNYTDSVPSDSIIELLLKAGMAAHSSGNKQPWRLIVVDDKAIKDSIGNSFHNARSTADAPVAIVVCGVPSETYSGNSYWVADCSAMSQNIALAAHSMGWGSIISALYPKEERVDKVRELLQVPDSIVPYAIIPIGYPKAVNTAKNKWDEDKVYKNRFN